MAVPERAARRTAEESKALILCSAAALFRTNGFAETTTREIADRAGVAERILFRHYPTKLALFEAVVASPFVDFITEFAGAWSGGLSTSRSEWELTEAFIRNLLVLFAQNRTLVLDLARLGDGAGGSGAGPSQAVFTEFFDAVLSMSMRRADLVPEWESASLPIDVRLTVGLVLSVSLFGGTLGAGLAPPLGPTEIVRELTRFVLHGVDAPTGNEGAVVKGAEGKETTTRPS